MPPAGQHRWVAEELHIAKNTVRNHVQRPLERLGVNSQLEAVAVAVREDVVQPP